MKATFGVLVACAVAVFAQAARADLPSWTHYPQSNFPARIKSVIFPGNRLDPSSPVRWGSWTVQYGDKVAAFQKSGFFARDADHSAIVVTGLECKNEISGSIPCMILLTWFTQGAYDCFVRSIDKPGDPLDPRNVGDALTFRIDCPLGLRF